MTWCKFFQCFSCCRKSNRISHDVTLAPKGPQPLKPQQMPPKLELPAPAQKLEDIQLELDSFRL